MNTSPPFHSQQCQSRSSCNHYRPRNFHCVGRRGPLSILTENTKLRLPHAREVRYRAGRDGRKPRWRSSADKYVPEVVRGVVIEIAYLV